MEYQNLARFSKEGGIGVCIYKEPVKSSHQRNGSLNCKKGDIITIIKPVGDGEYLGTFQNQVGHFLMEEVDVIYMNLSAASPQANPDKYTTFNSILASNIQPITLSNDVHQFENLDNNGTPIITTESYHSQNSEPIPKIERTKLGSNNNNSPKLGASLEVRKPMKTDRKSLPTFSKLFESEDKEIYIPSRPKFRLDTDSNGSTSRGSSEKDGVVPSQGYSSTTRDINRNGAGGGTGFYGNSSDSSQSPSFKFSISQMKKAASSTLLGTKIDPSLLLLRSKKSSNSTNGNNSSSNFSTASLNSYSSLKSSYLKANQNPSLCVDEFGFIQGNSDAEDDDKDHWNESTLSPKNIDLNSVKEGKWLMILETWTPHQARKSYRVKKLLETGAPEQMRGQIWMFLANTRMYYKKGKFEELLSMEEVPIFEIIERDINRTYPKHVMFSDTNGDGQKDLNRILKAYAQYNPEVGYCQGMGMLVGLMLMQGLNAEETFWLLVATIDQYLQGYYSPSLTQVKIHCEVFDLLLAEEDSKLAKHLKKNDVSPLIYITQWFLTVFTMTLPWPSVLRVWDLFYFKGVKIMFRFGLTIMACLKEEILTQCPSSMEIIPMLLHPPHSKLSPDSLMHKYKKVLLKTQHIQKLCIKVKDNIK